MSFAHRLVFHPVYLHLVGVAGCLDGVGVGVDGPVVGVPEVQAVARAVGGYAAEVGRSRCRSVCTLVSTNSPWKPS